MATFGWRMTAFNSLSRDHSHPHRPNIYTSRKCFQLPLSGSREIVEDLQFVEFIQTFNSLSRDHWQLGVRRYAKGERIAFNYLSRDHSPVMTAESRERMRQLLSTPSLGITYIGRRATTAYLLSLSTPSLGITGGSLSGLRLEPGETFNSLSRDH